MGEFIQVAALDQVPSGTVNTIMVGDTSVALFNVQGAVYAINDTCKVRQKTCRWRQGGR